MTSRSLGKLVFFSALALISTRGMAVEPNNVNAGKPEAQTLAKVTSDRDGSVSRLVAVLDSIGQLQAIRFDTKNQNTQKTTSESFSMKQIASPQGVVLVESSGYKALILKGNVDSKSGTGKFTVNYLADAFQNNYVSCHALVQRSKEGKWEIIDTASKKQIDELYIQSHMTGITTIKGICH